MILNQKGQNVQKGAKMVAYSISQTSDEELIHNKIVPNYIFNAAKDLPHGAVKGAHWVEYEDSKSPFRCSVCGAFSDHICAYCEKCKTKMNPEIEIAKTGD